MRIRLQRRRSSVESALLESDDEVHAAAASQDRQAFAPLYDRYLDPIYRYCYRRLGTKEAAEDATTQVFIRALAALPNYQRGCFRSWLFTIAHNVVADAYSRAGHDRRSATLADAMAVPDPDPSPEEIALTHTESLAIRDLLAHLAPEQRVLLELRLAGLTDAEIAQVVGRSHGAVRVALHRAIASLRDLLTAQGTMRKKP
jgi:RNA polymerase sigma-70 factor (ECF subfamily)